MPAPDFSETAAMVREHLGDRPRGKLMRTLRLLRFPALQRKLDRVEQVLGEEEANRWLVDQLVATGHYIADGDFVRPYRRL